MTEHMTATNGHERMVPHFEITDIDGERVRYADLWQHRNLVYVNLDPLSLSDTRQYVRDLVARAPEFANADTALVISTERVDGLPSPGVAIADRWGEVIAARELNAKASPPAVDELLEWITFVQEQCPECPPK